MRVEKEEIVIRSAVVGDSEQLTVWWNDGRVMAHAGFPKGLNQSVEETIRQIRRNETKLSQLCIIEIKGVPVGEISYGIGEGIAEIGIKICDTQYQNRGYGSKVLKMLIEFLFTDKNINSGVTIETIKLDTNLKNTRAQHVYEKLGFEKVATNRDAWKDQLGEWQSSVEYELKRDTYEM